MTADAHRRAHPRREAAAGGGDGEGVVELAEGGAAADPGGAGVGVEGDAVEVGEVDDDEGVVVGAGGEGLEAVPAATEEDGEGAALGAAYDDGHLGLVFRRDNGNGVEQLTTGLLDMHVA